MKPQKVFVIGPSFMTFKFPILFYLILQLQYCNLGWSLASGVDFNNDGYNDLVIGSPYAHTEGGKQRGMVNVMFASTKWAGKDYPSVK